MSNEKSFTEKVKSLAKNWGKKAGEEIPVFAEKVGREVKKAGEIGRGSIDIRLIEAKLDGLYKELGKEVFPLLKKKTLKTQFPDQQVLIGEIDQLLKQVKEKEAKIQSVKDRDSDEPASKKAAGKKTKTSGAKKTNAKKASAKKSAAKKKTSRKKS